MIDKNIKLIYKYMFTRDQWCLIALLLNHDGRKFANEYFVDRLRQECIDIISSNLFLKNHFEEQVYYVDKYINKKTIIGSKGCFRRT